MAHLIPTQVTDRNGRITTVHKKAQVVNHGVSRIPAPPAVTPVAKEMPLMLPEPLSKKEAEELIEGTKWADFAIADRRTKDNLYLTSNAELAVIKMVLDRGVLDPSSVREISNKYMPAPHSGINRLLMVERMGTIVDIGSTEYGPLLRHLNEICAATDGLGRNLSSTSKIMGPITTEEELNRCSAVIEFLFYKDFPDKHSVSTDMIDDNGYSVRATYIKNKHLDCLIRERPEDVKAIIEYVKARGMHPTNKGPVKALQAYLDETAEASSVGSGWL